MISFYLAAATLVIVALALLLRPWWRAGGRVALGDAALGADLVADVLRVALPV